MTPFKGPAARNDRAAFRGAGTGVVQRLSFTILIAFVFMIFNRVFDLYLTGLHLPGISHRLIGLFLLITGAFVAAFPDRIGKLVLGFTLCFLAAIPFSIWRGAVCRFSRTSFLSGLWSSSRPPRSSAKFSQYVRAAPSLWRGSGPVHGGGGCNGAGRSQAQRRLDRYSQQLHGSLERVRHPAFLFFMRESSFSRGSGCYRSIAVQRITRNGRKSALTLSH